MTDVFEKRVEAAARAIYDLKPVRTAIMGPLGWTDPEFDQWADKGGFRQKARAALEAADAVVTVEMIAEVVRDADVRWDIAESSDGPFDPRTHSEAIAEAIQRLYRGEEQS